MLELKLNNKNSMADIDDARANKLVFIPISQLVPNTMNSKELSIDDSLKESIKEIGLNVPLDVIEMDDGRYEISSGERRYTAIKYLHDKFFDAGDTTKANLFGSIQAFIYDGISSEKEEQIYKKVEFPNEKMSISLENYSKIACNMMYIPIHPSEGKQSKSLIESLHCLFTLYSGFKENKHFQNKDDKAKDFQSMKFS